MKNITIALLLAITLFSFASAQVKAQTKASITPLAAEATMAETREWLESALKKYAKFKKRDNSPAGNSGEIVRKWNSVSDFSLKGCDFSFRSNQERIYETTERDEMGAPSLPFQHGSTWVKNSINLKNVMQVTLQPAKSGSFMINAVSNEKAGAGGYNGFSPNVNIIRMVSFNILEEAAEPVTNALIHAARLCRA